MRPGLARWTRVRPALIVLTAPAPALRAVGFQALLRLLPARPWVLASELPVLRRRADVLVRPERGVFADTALAMAPRRGPLVVEELVDRTSARLALARSRRQVVLTSVRATPARAAADVLTWLGLADSDRLLISVHRAPRPRSRPTLTTSVHKQTARAVADLLTFAG